MNNNKNTTDPQKEILRIKALEEITNETVAMLEKHIIEVEVSLIQTHTPSTDNIKPFTTHLTEDLKNIISKDLHNFNNDELRDNLIKSIFFYDDSERYVINGNDKNGPKELNNSRLFQRMVLLKHHFLIKYRDIYTQLEKDILNTYEEYCTVYSGDKKWFVNKSLFKKNQHSFNYVLPLLLFIKDVLIHDIFNKSLK